MSISQPWKWEMLKEDDKQIWRNPSEESYYLVNRWKTQGKTDFLDLGCGMGRHAILFGKNGFKVSCFDISEEAIRCTKQWAEEEKLSFEYEVGDMLELPYADNSLDCIMCRNVISHSNTEGVRQAIAEILRVLRKDGECYLTLAAKDTWGFRREDWPLIDPNTRVRMEEGPEYGVPHFYADYAETKQLFSDFTIVTITHVETYYEHNGEEFSSTHYHLLVRK